MQKIIDIDEISIYILALLTYIPSDMRGSMIRIVVVGLIFFYKYLPSFKIDRKIGIVAISMIASPLIPMIVVFLVENSNFSVGIFTHELMRMLFCALTVLAVSKLNVSFRCVYIVTLIVLLPNLVIQIMQYMQFDSVFAFISQHYVTPDSEWSHLELAKQTDIDFRSGSIFLNPNVYMVIPLLSLVVFLQKDRANPSIFNYIYIGCAIVSCFLTGSRTATVVLAIIFILYYVRYATKQSRIIFLLAFILIVMRFGGDLVAESRAFQLVSEGDSDSLMVKFRGFLWFWQSTSAVPLYWVSGSLGSQIASGIDCEWGHIYTWYGIFGVLWYIQYIRIALKRNSGLSYYAKPLTYVCVFVAITASVLLCMPIYSFVAVLLFANVEEIYKGDEYEIYSFL